MTFDRNFTHINVLNDARFSGHGVRICHNVAMKLFFVNCTATNVCQVEMKSLITILGKGYRCNGCRKDYPFVTGETEPVFRESDIDNELDHPSLKKWFAAWLNVEERYIDVTVDR